MESNLQSKIISPSTASTVSVRTGSVIAVSHAGTTGYTGLYIVDFWGISTIVAAANAALVNNNNVVTITNNGTSSLQCRVIY